MTVLGALARPSISNAIQSTPWGDWSDSGTTWAGANVSAQSSLRLLTVYGCNRFICDGISTLPVDTFRKSPGGRAAPLTNSGILEEPAADLDFISWATQFLTSLLLGGDFFGLRVWRDSFVSQVIPLDPTKVQPYRAGGRKRFQINGQEYSTLDIMHVPAIMWPGTERGLSPVEYARQGIGMGLAAQEYGARFFDQDSTPGGVIEVPGELLPEKATEMARGWSKKHGGKSKSNLPGVLQGGATWKQTSVTNEQAQFLETRKFTASEIAAQMFLIDPPEMGLPVEGTSLTYTNQEERSTRKVQVTFLPWLVRIEKALSSLIPRGQYVKLNVDALLRGDMKSRFESYGIGIDKQFMVPNQARDLEDWEPLPGGDSVVPKTPAPAPPGGSSE